MRLLIDNNDGAGLIDYTQCVRADAPLSIMRRRGTWTVCEAGLDLESSGLPKPASRAQVRVVDASGSMLFEGVAHADAVSSASALSTMGAAERVLLQCVETAWMTKVSPSTLLQPATAVRHDLQLSDVSLRLHAPDLQRHDLATDVTVAGGEEAAEYVTELFRGDGATQNITLQHAPFRESGTGTLLDDAFDGARLNAAVWSRVDAGNYLTLGSGGLRMSGGTGFDGATVLRFASPVELGGSLLAEASGAVLDAGSDGVLLGFYDGTVSRAQCVAGIRVRGASGAQSFVALVNGAEQLTTYQIVAGHRYTMRVRLHSPEMQRVRTRYSVLVDGVLQQFGGDAVDAPLRVVIEVVDTGLASSTQPTVLYDGALSVSPLQAVFALANSVSLSGSVERTSLRQMGSCAVTSTAVDGTVRMRREGPASAGADYILSGSGVLTFAPGLLPQPGELVTVQYRRGRRAAARRVDDTAAFQKVALGLPGVPTWTGRVLSPAARSSADCDAAAKALVCLATGSATGIAGTVEWTRGGAYTDDVSPGDTLLLHVAGGVQMLPVQFVRIEDLQTDPESASYHATFAQSWAESMDFRVGEGAATDLQMPVIPAMDVVLPGDLQGLQVTLATSTSLQVDAGTDPVAGGGFEVRRSDANFGTANTEDLVLRSPVRSFSVPRANFTERFFVRMYDNSVPPRYSGVSSVVVTSLPVR